MHQDKVYTEIQRQYDYCEWPSTGGG